MLLSHCIARPGAGLFGRLLDQPDWVTPSSVYAFDAIAGSALHAAIPAPIATTITGNPRFDGNGLLVDGTDTLSLLAADEPVPGWKDNGMDQEGWCQIEFLPLVSNDSALLALWAGPDNFTRIYLQDSPAGSITFQNRSPDLDLNFTTHNQVVQGRVNRLAWRWKHNDFALCLNGGPLGIDTSVSLPMPHISEILIGRFGGINPYTGYISRLQFGWGYRDNQDLKSMSLLTRALG